MKCPECGGAMWDNRPKKSTGEFSAKSPDFKCKDKNCEGVIWPDNGKKKNLGGGGENTQKPVQAASSSSQNFNGLDERQRAIIRQHSQSMALEVLKLKVTLNELTVEDLTPAKLRSLADYFDGDVLGAAK